MIKINTTRDGLVKFWRIYTMLRRFRTTPNLTKSLNIAKADLGMQRNFIICPVASGYPLAVDVEVLGIGEWDMGYGFWSPIIPKSE